MPRRPSVRAAPLLALLMGGCANEPASIRPVEQVDLGRFMGDWYVIAHIPSWPERRAYNAVESYTLASDGSVRTTFQFRNDGFDTPLRTMRPVGYVRPGTGNAVWGMQFIWPVKAEYVIVHLDAAYQETIIGRSARDYAWIMARTPAITDATQQRLRQKLLDLGYSLDGLRSVPQQWPETAHDRRRGPMTTTAGSRN